MPNYCSIYDTTENKEGDYFEEVFFDFITGDPIRNLGWAKGVYCELRPGDVVTLYYVDENSNKLNHENNIDCFSIKDLSSHDWVAVRLPHEYLS